MIEGRAKKRATSSALTQSLDLRFARFLAEQLASLAAQTVPSLDILVSDDGSTDGTLEMLEETARRWDKGRFTIMAGPGAGSAAENFRSLILSVEKPYESIAFCDQDDIWLPTKLECAVAEIGSEPAVPQVHCARTELIDPEGKSIGLSPYFRRPPNFSNALVQSLAGGNTMVMNRKAFELVRAAAAKARFVSHDWWTYQVVTGTGGRIVYSAVPDTRYRQHANNDVGANVGLLARAHRVVALFGGRFRRWNDVNLEALTLCEDLLTADARKVLRDFGRARTGSLWNRLAMLRRSGAYRQTVAGQVSLYGACILRLL